MMHIGVAASRHGLTDPQKVIASQTLIGFRLIAPPDGITLHHGDCINGDEYLAELAASIGYLTEAHPGDYERLRADHTSTVRWPPQKFWVRNGHILAAISRLIAFPNTPTDPGVGSGTWQMIRRATGVKPVVVVLPNGDWHRQ